MVDPTITSAAASSTLSSAQTSPAPTPVDVTLTAIPDKIQQLIRQLEVNATVTKVQNNVSVSLNSLIGPLTINLPQLTDALQQKLVQQFSALAQTQRAISVIIQPGDPPSQAVIFLPQPANQAPLTPQSVAVNPSLPPAAPQPIPVTTGTVLTAIVLPPNINTQTTAAPQQPIPVFIPPPASSGAAAEALPGATLPPPPSTLFGTNNPSPVTYTPTNIPTSITPLLQTPPAPATISQQNPTITALPATPTFSMDISAAAPAPLAPLTPQSLTTAAPQSANVAGQGSPPASQPGQPQTPLQSPTVSLAPQAPAAAATALPSAIQTNAVSLLQTANNEVSLRIDAIISPPPPVNTNGIPTPPALPNLGPNQIFATVANSSPTGQVILQSGDTALYIRQPVDVPTGTNLVLTVDQSKNATLQTLPPLAVQDFSNLQTAVNTLTQINPQLAQQVLTNHIPQPTAALPGALLFFMSALKQSSVRTWLGDDAVDGLTRAGKFELITKLSQDLGKAGQTVSDTLVGEWRSYPIPLHANNQFQILNFYVHENQGRNQRGSDGAASAQRQHTRFVIDVRMSQLGPMQLDGFIQQKKLDIMVRSEHVLPEGLHHELRQVYTNALSGIDYAGSLNFQVGRKHWLIIQNAKAQAQVVT